MLNSILPRGDRLDLNKSITVVNDVLRRKAQTSGCVFLNSVSNIFICKHLGRDDLHLNKPGVTKMADNIENIIKNTPLQINPSQPPFHQGNRKIVRPVTHPCDYSSVQRYALGSKPIHVNMGSVTLLTASTIVATSPVSVDAMSRETVQTFLTPLLFPLFCLLACFATVDIKRNI